LPFLFILILSLKSILTQSKPSIKTALHDLGSYASLIGTASGLILGVYKILIARLLASAIVYADAVSSICAGLASFVALVISEDHALAWWLDGASGTVVALYTLYQGASTMMNSSVSSLCIISSLALLSHTLNFPYRII
jgi:divalent metal cation (Fe/Co/Zn/Cd) transporter